VSVQHKLTVSQLRDYCDAHIATGHGQAKVALDRRGLNFLTDKPDVFIGLPHDDNTHDDERVFIRAVF